MNYTLEARYCKQSLYGGYCNMCRKLQLEIVPYHSFNDQIYQETKLLSKQIKKKVKMESQA